MVNVFFLKKKLYGCDCFMSFASGDLPPLFEKIVREIEKRGGLVSPTEFSDICFIVRVSKAEVRDIRNWLSRNGFIRVKRSPCNCTVEIVDLDRGDI